MFLFAIFLYQIKFLILGMQKYRHIACYLSLVLCCVFSLCIRFNAYAEEFVLQCKILDKITKRPISNVNYYVMEIIGEECIPTDLDGKPYRGEFVLSFPNKPNKGQYRLIINALSPKEVSPDAKNVVMTDLIAYDSKEIELEIPESAKKEYRLPTIYLERHRNKKLKEVAVNATKIMFYHKGDTLVYNADAFVMQDGSMLDGLLRQMPGVELRENGVVLCNGKAVNKLLLNGKDLFNGQRELMLENIAAYTIKDIAFYDKTGHKSRLMGVHMNDSEFVLDVRLKKEYSGGFTVNADGGYGTRNRYLGKAFGLMFTDYFSLSARGSSNNLSDVNKPEKTENLWNPASISSGKISQSLGGLTYFASGPENRWEIKGNADFIAKNTDFSSETNNEIFINGASNQYQTIKDNPLTRSRTVTTDHEFFTKLGNKAYINIIPKFSYCRRDETEFKNLLTSTNPNPSNSEQLISTSSFVNHMINELKSDNDELKTSLLINSCTRFSEGLSRSMLTVDVSCNYQSLAAKRFENYRLTTGVGEEMMTQLSHRLYKNNPNYNLQAGGCVSYFRYIFKIPTVFEYKYTYTENKKIQSAFQLDRFPDYDASLSLDNFSMLNEDNLQSIASQSYNSLEKSHSHLFKFNPQIIRCDLHNGRTEGWIYTDIRVDINRRVFDYFSNDKPIKLSHTAIIPQGDISLNLREPVWSTYIQFDYQKRKFDLGDLVSRPSSDPLQIYNGNSSLKLSDSYEITLRYKKQGGIQRSQILSAYAIFIDKPVIHAFTSDYLTGIRTYAPVNGKHHIYADLSYEINTPLDKKYRFNLSSKTTLKFSQDLNRIYEMTSYIARENLKISWRYYRALINVFADAMLDATRYSERENKINRLSLKYGVDGFLDLPNSWFISTDFSLYTRRGFYSSKLNTTDLVWNIHISKSILKRRLIFAIDAYDILQQVSNVTFTTNRQYRSETMTYGVPSFVMLHVQFRFNKQPKRH